LKDKKGGTFCVRELYPLTNDFKQRDFVCNKLLGHLIKIVVTRNDGNIKDWGWLMLIYKSGIVFYF